MEIHGSSTPVALSGVTTGEVSVSTNINTTAVATSFDILDASASFSDESGIQPLSMTTLSGIPNVQPLTSYTSGATRNQSGHTDSTSYLLALKDVAYKQCETNEAQSKQSKREGFSNQFPLSLRSFTNPRLSSIITIFKVVQSFAIVRFKRFLAEIMQLSLFVTTSFTLQGISTGSTSNSVSSIPSFQYVYEMRVYASL
ncbi:hypothetical protein L6452_36451 [Arctium lappa]|uniref:Uncharacterized protein n=1 Tax=Arctium lappa TaxID=4217 RepID=A0ACB8Y9D2_ARCLA|nr:hypothetical protein L6452_36451 [Arctium lappa]